MTQEHIVIMFDWDNTLMASADFLREVHEKTAEKLKALDIHLKKAIPAIATKKKEDILKELFGDENLEKVLPVFQEVYDQTFKPTELKMLVGAKELLQKLIDANLSVAIVSNYTETGIKEHLDLRNIDHSKIAIIGVDTASNTKPHIAPGILALEKLNLSPQRETVQVLMIGDGISSDMAFASNMHQYLRGLNKDSGCQGILFNSLISGDTIFPPAEIEKFTAGDGEYNRTVTYGYARVGKNIRDALIPYQITPEALAKQKAKLRPIH